MTERELCEAVELHAPAFCAKAISFNINWKALVAAAWSIIGSIVKNLGPTEAVQAVAWIVAYIEAWLSPPPVNPPAGPPTPITPPTA